jgi:hypothetical protein
MIIRRTDFGGFGLTANQMRASVVGKKLVGGPVNASERRASITASIATNATAKDVADHGPDPYANGGTPDAWYTAGSSGSGGLPSGSGYDASTGSTGGSGLPPNEEGMSLGVKIAIGLGAAVVILGGAYAASSRR